MERRANRVRGSIELQKRVPEAQQVCGGRRWWTGVPGEAEMGPCHQGTAVAPAGGTSGEGVGAGPQVGKAGRGPRSSSPRTPPQGWGPALSQDRHRGWSQAEPLWPPLTCGVPRGEASGTDRTPDTRAPPGAGAVRGGSGSLWCGPRGTFPSLPQRTWGRGVQDRGAGEARLRSPRRVRETPPTHFRWRTRGPRRPDPCGRTPVAAVATSVLRWAVRWGLTRHTEAARGGRAFG